MDKLATMDTIGSSFRPWLSCQGICLLNRHQTGDTDSVQPGILLPVQRDSQETFIPCEARMLWYSADRTSSQQLRDTTPILQWGIKKGDVQSFAMQEERTTPPRRGGRGARRRHQRRGVQRWWRQGSGRWLGLQPSQGYGTIRT